jgi:hypothetical protein
VLPKLELTLSNTSVWEITSSPKKLEAWEMVYTMEEGQLLRLWSVIRCFEVIRGVQDPIAQSEILTRAQMLLMAFVLELKPSPEVHTGSATLGREPDQTVKLAA